MTKFIELSGLPVYHKVKHDGVWRLFLVRNGLRTGEIMLKIQIDSTSLSPERVSKLKEELVSHLTSAVKLLSDETKETTSVLKSIYLQQYAGFSNSAPSSCPDELIYGENYFTERLYDLTFRISPAAFFQVNTPTAEVLYSVVRNWGNVKSTTTILDICCGTGTIGLSLAKQAHRVIGLEMEESAIRDAEQNAKINGITNATYICGKAEDTLKKALEVYGSSDDLLAIVDPPRAGLHHEVLRLLRNCQKIKRLVYVSCNPDSLAENLKRFLAPPTKRFKREPFKAVRAISVDLFPHTPHCEMVVLLTR
eukprot:TRINITY_DN30183_c0_g1_i4.p1 TRINITY_DN30183_c0_g1~~TRINITY_DN30183_c0_g1_i4.p1  ORF type:complete len:308 (+),score=33.80 TRINITY_DN30183_c0_g1_i4:210-1133(+)